MNKYIIEYAVVIESDNEKNAMKEFIGSLSEKLESDYLEDLKDYFTIKKIKQSQPNIVSKPFVVSKDGANGTSLQGYVRTTFDNIVKVFGEPPILDGDKTTVEWCIKFSDGTEATIYDYKTSRTPKGMYEWHVGGNDKTSVSLVAKQLGIVPTID